MNEKALRRMAIIGQVIILATMLVFLCHLHNTGIRFTFNNGIDFYLYNAEKFSWLMGMVLTGSLIGSGIYFFARQKLEATEPPTPKLYRGKCKLLSV